MRATRRLLIVLLILVVVLVAADRITLHIAENEVAGKIQTARNLPEKPSVSIAGFPFLTQVAASKFGEVKVTATTLSVDAGGTTIQLRDFRLDAKGVKVSDHYSKSAADSATGSASISYADLSAALPNHMTVAYGGAPGKVKVSGTVDLPILGAQKVAGTADVSVANGTDISLGNISGLTGIDPSVAALVSSFLQPQLKIAGLPSGLELNSLQPGPDGVSATVSGTGVSLS